MELNMVCCMCKNKIAGDHSLDTIISMESPPPAKQHRGASPGKNSRGSSAGKQSKGSSPSKKGKGGATKKGSKDSAVKQVDKDNSFIEKLTKERNEFQEKCKALQEQLEKINSGPRISQQVSPSKIQNGDSLKRNLKEKDDKISKLEKNIQNLTREKHELMSKLDESKKWGDDKGTTQKTANSKAEKERDLARGDCKKLEEERDSLRQRLKQVTEAHSAETQKLQHLVTETEKKLRQLESERHELTSVQGARRATINNLEEKVESLSSQLRTTQSELDHLRTLHSQLKTLHEQTDQALANSQRELNDIGNEYSKALNRIRDLEKKHVDMECECSKMKQDCNVLKTKLTSIDAERDHLLIEIDNKTERIANLETELNARNGKVMALEKSVAELQQKLSSFTDELSTKEYLLKSNSTEINTVRRNLDEAMKDKTSAAKENKRLQEDYAKICYECKCANNELERAKREIDDLKTQLQQYVYEIKRAEDLISKKEIERTEMLDQFRNLSEETTVLETNNHTLESQAMEVRNQLMSATNHIHDLESRVDQLNTLNKDYERQISQMTKQIASLETQVRQSGSINRNIENEMSDMKCLCVKLDEQKDTLKKEVKQRDEYTHQLEVEKERLRSELSNLQDALQKETSNIGSLENLLAACRQETVEQRLLNQELQGEIHRLKNMIQELQNKLKDNKIDLGQAQSSAKHLYGNESEKDTCCDYRKNTCAQRTLHKVQNERERQEEKRKDSCCDFRKNTCSKRNPHKIPSEVPEKTILDEVYQQKTVYCSGTQQNPQAYAERNAVYRPCPQLEGRLKAPQTYDDINEVSLGRFYIPDKSHGKCCREAQTQGNSCSCAASKCRTICLCIPVEKTDSDANAIVASTVCSVCSRKIRSLDENKSQNYATKGVGKFKTNGRKSVHIESAPIIEEDFGEKVKAKANVDRPQTSPNLQKKITEKPEQKTKSQKNYAAGLVRNSAFWREEPESESEAASASASASNSEPRELNEEMPEQRIRMVPNVPCSEPTIRNNCMQKHRCYKSDTKPTNALDHESFHSPKPPIQIKMPKERRLTAKEENAIRKSRRQTQALTFQKSILLRKTLNLEDSRTKLIYHTTLPDVTAPFRSRSSERNYGKHYGSSHNTSVSDNDNSNTIIVIPETCKQYIVDCPMSVTFSCDTPRCKTIEDIDAKCRKLMKLNLQNSDDDLYYS